MGTSIKLFGASRMEGDRTSAFVAPVMIGKDHPLYSVRDVYNGILVKGNMLGTSMFYGSGAGKLPTASAVVADMIEAAQNEACHVPMGWSEERLPIEPIEKARFRYFLRVSGLRKDGEALAVKAFGTADVYEVAGLEEFGLLTGEMTEEEFRQRAEALKREGGPALLQKIRAEL